jgi:hypothetical protein
MRGARLGLIVALSAWGIAAPGSAQAFDYDEHYAITRAALERLGDARLTTPADALAQLAGAGAHLCFPPTSLRARAGRACFVVADIPALAGDHAVSPGLLLGRWLRRRGDEDSLPQGGAGDDEDPSCGEERRRLPDFLAAINQLEAGQVGPAAAERALAAADPAYACLARQSANQFRIPAVAAVAAPFAAEPDAAKSYYEWHERARAALAIAAAEPDQAWPGVALLCELFADHFLQDALAAGRMTTPRDRLDDAAIAANRAHHDRGGVRVLLPPALCHAPAPAGATLAARCRAQPAYGRVYGDHALARPSRNGAAGPADDVTFDAAVALTAASLRDLFDAPADPALGQRPCAHAMSLLPAGENAAHWLDRTWEDPACAVAALAGADVTAGAAAAPPTAAGAVAILAMVPSPVEAVPTFPLHGGAAWHFGEEVGTKYAAIDVGISWLTRPRRDDQQLAFGLHLFSALDRGASGGGLFAEYVTGQLLAGAGINGLARTIKSVDMTGSDQSSLALCVVPLARLGLDLRLFERGLATALYASGGPMFCQGESVGADVLFGLRLSIISGGRAP